MAGTLRSTGPAGPIILAVMGAIWAMVGLDYAGVPPVWWAAPVVIAGAIVALVVQRSRGLVPPPAAEGRRIGRLVGIWSGVEGVAIFVAINVCINLQRPDWVVPAICVIVGLHFLPLARGLPVRLYYATGAAMTVLGLLGLADLTLLAPAMMVAFGAALLLWGTALRVLT